LLYFTLYYAGDIVNTEAKMDLKGDVAMKIQKHTDANSYNRELIRALSSDTTMLLKGCGLGVLNESVALYAVAKKARYAAFGCCE